MPAGGGPAPALGPREGAHAARQAPGPPGQPAHGAGSSAWNPRITDFTAETFCPKHWRLLCSRSGSQPLATRGVDRDRFHDRLRQGMTQGGGSRQRPVGGGVRPPTVAALSEQVRRLDAEVRRHERTQASLERLLREKEAL